MSIEKTAKFHLSLFYGDKEKCIDCLVKTMSKYENCKNQTDKILERIEQYKIIIKYLKDG